MLKHAIVNHFDDQDPDVNSKYNRPRLVSLLYEEAIAPKTNDNVLRAFFLAMKLPMDGPPFGGHFGGYAHPASQLC